jgi:hypothetical protein
VQQKWALSCANSEKLESQVSSIQDESVTSEREKKLLKKEIHDLMLRLEKEVYSALKRVLSNY